MSEATKERKELAGPSGSVTWDEYAAKALQSHISAVREMAENIAIRCNLPTVNDYTVGMAIREVSKENAQVEAQPPATKL